MAFSHIVPICKHDISKNLTPIKLKFSGIVRKGYSSGMTKAFRLKIIFWDIIGHFLKKKLKKFEKKKVFVNTLF